MIRHLLKGCSRCGREVSGFLRSADHPAGLRPVIDRAVDTFLAALPVKPAAPRVAAREKAWRSYTAEASAIV
ncbi:MAG TPA: hypothetical protein VF789_28360 [Thermoanaerobaculia bacterium]